MKGKILSKILVAMSGGVDSSVAAALLKERGFDVAGAFIKCWDDKDAFGNCASAAEEKLARQTAKILQIPLYVFDFTREYKKHVFKYFLDAYKAGRTPNPDVACNKHIKFGLFLEKARALGFDNIATGHYVKTKNEKRKTKNLAKIKLLRAKDKNKDQSYFLWQLTQDQLRYCLFPVGDYAKPQVRELARKFGLPNADKKDSQGICFVGKVKLDDFLGKYIPANPGKIMDKSGNILGQHPNIVSCTTGQRHGIGLAGGPWWVLDKNLKDNILIVTRDKKDLCRNEIGLQGVHWTAGAEPKLPIKIKAAIRYRQKPAAAMLIKNKKFKAYVLKFVRPQEAVAQGQSAVFYRGEELLGGGTIK